MRTQTAKANKTHGFARTPTYITWRNIKSRCLNPQNSDYKNYGARGIVVCNRWLENFENFLADMGEKPENCSIERINVNGDYNRENCKWATRHEQDRNLRRNVYLSFNGKEQCITDWAKEVGLNRHVLRYRIKAGWSVEDALTVPASLGNNPNTRLK